MNTDDIIDEIQYLKKKTVLLEKLLNTNRQNRSEKNAMNVTKTDDATLLNLNNSNDDTSLFSLKKRSIC